MKLIYFITTLVLCLSMSKPAHANSIAWNSEDHYVYYGDFNGDGVTDVLLQPNTEELYQAILYGTVDSNDGVKFELEKAQYFPDYEDFLQFTPEKVSIIVRDINGDNLDDIVVAYKSLNKMAVFLGHAERVDLLSGGISFTDELLYPFLSNLNDYQLHAGKFSSSAKSDILLIANDSESKGEHYLLSMQGNTLNVEQEIKFNEKTIRKSDVLHIADLNNDGYDDIFFQAFSSNQKHHIVFNTGDGVLDFKKPQVISEKLLEKSWHAEAHSLLISNMNDDPNLEIVRLLTTEEKTDKTNTVSTHNVSSQIAAAPGCDSPFSMSYSTMTQTASYGCEPVEPPSAPKSVSVPSTDNDGIVTISWEPGTIQVAGQYYKLQKSFNGGSYTGLAAPNSTSYTYSGMSNGTYRFRVKGCVYDTSAYREYCSSYTYSNYLTVDAPQPPAAPTLNSLSGPLKLGQSFSISWSGSADDYVLQHKSPFESSYSTYATTTSKSINTTINSPKGSHCFRVYGRNGGVAGPVSAQKCATFDLAPVVNPSGTIEFNEDSSYTVSSSDMFVENVEGHTTTLYVYSNSNYSVSSKTITPTANYYGSLSVKVRVKDNNTGFYSAYSYLPATVDNVNDRPVISEGSSHSISTNEDTNKSFTLNATDVEGDSLTWSIVTQGTRGSASASGTGTSKSITYSPNANTSGNDSFVVRVKDNGSPNRYDDISVSVSISPINDRPVISEGSSHSISTNEDTNKSFTLNATDVEGDSLTWSIVTQGTRGSASASGTGTSKSITYSPNANTSVNDSFVVRVKDNGSPNRYDDISVSVSISPINDPPNANAGADMERLEWQWTQINGSGTDIDGTIESYNWEQIAGLQVSNLTIVDANSIKFITPKITSDSSITFRLTVTDDAGATDTDDIVINLNDRPTISNVDIPSVNYKYRSDEMIHFAISGISDTSDNIVKVYNHIRGKINGEWQAIQSWKPMTLDSDKSSATYDWGLANTLNLQPNIQYQLVAQAIDDGLGNGNGWWKVQTVFINDKPDITGQSLITMDKNTSRTISISDITISDSDNSTHSLTVLAGTNYSFSGNTITPTTDFIGQININIKVNDGTEESNNFVLSVNVESIEPVKKIIFIHTDILGTPVAETDKNGDVQ